MRVLFVSHIFPRPGKPNLGIFSLHQCAALAPAGHPVRAVSPRPWTEGIRARPWQGDPPAGLANVPTEYPLYVYPPGTMRPAYGRFMWASCRRAIRRAFADFRPDCVLSYWVHPDGQVAHMAGCEAGIPSAVIVGGSDVLVLPHESAARGRQIRSVLHSVDAVITVSDHLRDATVALGVPADRVHTVYQGADRERFTPRDPAAARARLGIPTDGRVLVFVGSLLPVKGVDVMLDACARAKADGTDFRLYLVGDGPARADLEARAARLSLGATVRFVGSVRQHLLPDWYRAADLTVMASRSEGIPNVLREAMACGVPFVATRVGGIHEIADPAMDRLVPPEDPAALAAAITEALWAPRPPTREGRGPTWAASAERLVEVMRPLVYARAAIPVRRAVDEDDRPALPAQAGEAAQPRNG